MATVIPLLINGDDFGEDFTIGTKDAVDELQAALPDTVGTYTPTLVGASTNPNIGSTGVASGNYVLSGRLLTVEVAVVFGGTGISQGSGQASISLPPAITVGTLSSHIAVGTVTIVDASASQARDYKAILAGGAINMRPYADGALAGFGAFAWTTVGVTFAASDIVAARVQFYIP